MKKILFFLLSFSSLLTAQDFSILESDKVHFDGKQMIFKDGVLLENKLGKIAANSAEVSIEEGCKCKKMSLDGEVFISLKGSGQLQCDRAEIDAINCLATFFAGDKLPKVLYSVDLANGEKGSTPLSLQAKTLTMHLSPKDAAMKSLQETHADGEVEIRYNDSFVATCDHACSQSNETFILRGDVRADVSNFGTLTTDKELCIKRDLEGGGDLQYLECSGETVLRCENEEENLDCRLRCFGKIFLDHEKQQVRLSSPLNEEGAAEDFKQVFLQDHLVKLYADEAIIDYDVAGGGRINPTRMALTGNVRMTNRDETLLQYVLADRVLFFPDSQEMNFKASENKRVLLFDKVNNLQVSTTELKMKRDKETKKESFQGVGDVRFNFNEKEFEQIRKLAKNRL